MNMITKMIYFEKPSIDLSIDFLMLVIYDLSTGYYLVCVYKSTFDVIKYDIIGIT